MQVMGAGMYEAPTTRGLMIFKRHAVCVRCGQRDAVPLAGDRLPAKGIVLCTECWAETPPTPDEWAQAVANAQALEA